MVQQSDEATLRTFYQKSVIRHELALAAAVDEVARDAHLDEGRLDSDNVLSGAGFVGAFVSAAGDRNVGWRGQTSVTIQSVGLIESTLYQL